MAIKFLNGFALLVFLGSAPAHSHTVPELITIEELTRQPHTATMYYDLLRLRFSNDKFDEVLLFENDNVRDERLSTEKYNQMLQTLRNFIELHPEEAPRMRELPAIIPFKLSANAPLEILSQQQNAQWAAIGKILAEFSVDLKTFLNGLDDPSRRKVIADLALALSIDPVDVLTSLDLSNKQHQAGLIKAITNQYIRQRNQKTLTLIADLLISWEIGDRANRILQWQLPGSTQYVVFEDILKAAVRHGKEVGAPGKLTDALLPQSSLGAHIEISSFFRKGLTVTPMTRMEAVFKGIGPGECVRTACNRYLDALFDDSIHLKILKDGKETGFIGIYKTIDPKTGQKYWFIETIQSSFLASGTASSKIIRDLIRHLQQLAILDDSHLAVPSTTFNSYNYKEVVAELHTLPEVTAGRAVKAKMRDQERLKKIEDFPSSDLSEFDQTIVRASGYSATVLTNGYVFNRESMVVVQPLTDQPDWYIQRAHDLLSGKTGTLNQMIALNPVNRAALMKDMNSGIAVKIYLAQLRDQLLAQGRLEEVLALDHSIYEVIPRGLRTASFQKQKDYVEDQINHVVMPNSEAQKLKDELYLKVSSWQEYLELVELGDKSDGKYFAPFVMATIDRFSAEATPQELLKLYRDNIRHMPDDQFDLELTRKVGARLKTAEEFLQLVKSAKGEETQGYFADESMRDTYVVENWSRFYPETAPWKTRLNYAEELLNRVQVRADLQIRSVLFQKASTFKELKDIIRLSTLSGHLDQLETQVLSKMLSDRMIRMIEETPIDQLTQRQMAQGILPQYLTDHDQRRIKQAFLEQCSTPEDYRKLLKAMHLNYSDIMWVIVNDEADPETKAYLEKLVIQSLNHPSLYEVAGQPLTQALGTANKDELMQLHAEAKKATWREALGWARVLRSNTILGVNDAKKLEVFLGMITKLEDHHQLEVLSHFKEIRRVLLSDKIPSHRSLIQILNQWVDHLTTAGVPDAASILSNRFSIRLGSQQKKPWYCFRIF